MGRRMIISGTAMGALALGALAAGAPASGGDSQHTQEAARGGDRLVLARATASAAEGLATGATTGVKSRRLRGTSAGITPSMRASARAALSTSAIKQGLRPAGKMRREPYIPQNACYALELPGVSAFRDMLLQTFPRSRSSLGMYNISRGCNTPGVSEHEEGRALDFEANIDNPLQYAQAQRLLRYLTARGGYHAKRWGIMYIIYNKQIWAQYKPWWRGMSDRGNKVDNHQDHIHFSFTWNGALRQSSYWTGQLRSADRGPCVKYQWHFAPVRINKQVAKPRTRSCRGARPMGKDWQYSSSIMYWQSDSRVRWLQQFLSEEGVYTAEADGNFGQITFGAVRKWQELHKLPQTGVWDPVTQNASGRIVAKRDRTAVSGWTGGEQLVVPGQVVAVPVTVTTDGVLARSVAVQRKQADGEGDWVTITSGTTDAAGAYTANLVGEAGSWKYRLVVAESSRYGSATTPAKTLTVPVVPVG